MKQNLVSQKPLVLSLALNGYQLIFRRCLKSHRDYASLYGYDCVQVTRPAFTNLAKECAWLKIVLICAALRSGRPWVFFVDSDAQIIPTCPPVEQLIRSDSDVYMANGFSGRPNSGVILATSGADGFLVDVLRRRLAPVPPEDDVGWGENGHMIFAVRRYPKFQLIPNLWNNNSDPNLDDYIRHYSDGPMRPTYRHTLREKIERRTAGIGMKVFSRLGIPVDNLETLAARIPHYYPTFGSKAEMQTLLKDTRPLVP